MNELERMEMGRHCRYFSMLGWALFALLAAMAVVQVVAAAVAALLAPALLKEPLFYWVLSLVSVYVAGAAAFVLVIRRVPAPPRLRGQLLGPGRFFQVYGAAVGVAYLMNWLTLMVLELVGMLRGKAVENPVESLMDYPPALSLLLSCVVAPVVEELLFRRLLLERLRPYGGRFAVVASALCFGIFHGNFSQFFYAFAIGILFGWAALTTGRVWQVMLLHCMVNFLSVGVLPLLEWLGAPEWSSSLLVLGGMGIGIACLVGLVREMRFVPGVMGLSPRRTWRLFFENPGVALTCLAFLVLAVMSLG